MITSPNSPSALVFHRIEPKIMPRSSSSITLTDDDPVHKVMDNLSDVRVDLTNIQRPPNSRVDGYQRQRKLGYQNVLQRMIVQPAEPTSQKACDADETQEDEVTKLESWNRRIQLLRSHQVAEGTYDGSAVYSIRSVMVAKLLETLMVDFGQATHSSFLDDNYSVYLMQQERAAVSFKVLNKAALVYGDPLCANQKAGYVFEEFRRFCKKRNWRVAVIGASPNLAAYAQSISWIRMEFAVEQVFNPMRNEVLNEMAGKTITRTNRKLVREGVVLFLYEPQRGVQPLLEQELMDVYKGWRDERSARNAPQAYTAVINPFALSGVTRYLFTRGTDGKPNSLAGLMRLGAPSGYLLEPCIQSASAPKGTTGFLVTHAMGLLREENIHYMTFGVEALPHLGEITSMSSLVAKISRRVYSVASDALKLEGRQIFHQSFYPEKDHHVPLYLLFPPGMPHISVYQAVMKAGHVSPRDVWRHWQTERALERQERKLSKS